jgi:hypothetical protein
VLLAAPGQAGQVRGRPRQPASRIDRPILGRRPGRLKNRVHLDLRCDSFAAELERLTALGARVLAAYDSFVTLLDPEGNEFCLSRRTAR